MFISFFASFFSLFVFLCFVIHESDQWKPMATRSNPEASVVRGGEHSESDLRSFGALAK